MSKIKFHNVTCAIDLNFWHVLAKKKLEELKLSDEPVRLVGYYTTSANLDMQPVFRIIPDSFSENPAIPANAVKVCGMLKIFNTKEEFKAANLTQVLGLAGGKLNEDAICTFVLLVYADLKNFTFSYLVGFPVHNFAPLDYGESDLSAFPLEHLHGDLAACVGSGTLKSVFGLSPSGEIIENWTNAPIIAFIDPAPYADYPSSILRNIIGILHSQGKKGTQQFLSIKNSLSSNPQYFSLSNSKLFTVSLPEELKGFVGWELNLKQKLAPKIIDLRPQLDPHSLASSAVDLNLKLMRWRMLPDINLDVISSCKCLLLGAGTLGSQVSRNLLAWGIKHITFVDSSRVSYSNPVRQSLYEFEDAKLSALKAEKAAEKIRKIFPGAQTAGYCLEILMPGHSITTKENASESFQLLERLIQDHDAIFLLTDSRESRWLPTLISSALNKICFSVALGFDSFLVVRHGGRGDESKLGCYFCNDVVGPRNSLTDRTLDQQCTVTRPGLSYQASSVAVELLVSLLQHPLKHKAIHGESTILGVLPHQLRGTFGQFSIMQYCSNAFSKCTGCSEKVIGMYLEQGFEFVRQACNDPDFLEDVCELKELANVNEDDLIEVDEFID